MEDSKIIELYFERSETAIKETQIKYGRKLIQFDNISFAYNGNGERIRKGTTKYYYDCNGRLLKSSDGLMYIYDATGLEGFIYGGQWYHYRTDIQGNVIAILDNNGNVVLRYNYDAWGN